jgi:glycosyltransferase involved in cell wall biosynthesis
MLASFIIPTQNRAATLRQTLSSVHAIAKDQDVEVLVIDNASTDDTPQVCREESGKWRQGQFHYHFEPIPGLLSGRHRGAQESRGDILVYLDDDVVMQLDWFSGFLDVFSDPEVALAGGPSIPIYEIPPPDWLAGLWEAFDGGKHCGHLSLIDQGPEKKMHAIPPTFGV